MLLASHGWQSLIPYGGMVYHANKISPKRISNLGLTMGVHRDTIWTVKDDTDGTPDEPPELSGKLSICSARWIGWKNSEHRTLRTRLATDSRLNDKTTERTKRKTHSWQWEYKVLQSRHSERTKGRENDNDDGNECMAWVQGDTPLNVTTWQAFTVLWKLNSWKMRMVKLLGRV